MSYATMDHAEWVEKEGAAYRRRATRSKRATGSKGWDAAPDKLSPFQAKVCDILGIVGSGIYNAPIVWNSVVWDLGRGMFVPWKSSLASWDFNQLSLLVFCCHEARIRVEIQVYGPAMLQLTFHQRDDSARMGRRHPNLDEAVEVFRHYVPADHRIHYSNKQESQDGHED